MRLRYFVLPFAWLSTTFSVAVASPFTIEVGGITSNGAADINLAGDTTSSVGKVHVYESLVPPSDSGFIRTDVVDPHAVVTISDVTPFKYNASFGGLVAFATVHYSSNVDFPFFDDSGMFYDSVKGGEATFQIAQAYYPDNHFSEFTVTGGLVTLPRDSLAEVFNVDVTGNPFGLTVPLPRSAPLLGSALIALGIGALLKRRAS